MRIGIYIGNVTPQWGGAYTFESSILAALDRKHKDAEIFIFYKGKREQNNNTSLKWIEVNEPGLQQQIPDFPFKTFLMKLAKKTGIYKHWLDFKSLKKEIDELSFMRDFSHPLNDLLFQNQIDVIWFLSMHLIPVKIPFAMTLWDFGHRIIPMFPEVSTSGATWDAREKFYQAYLPKASHIIVGTETAKDDLEKYYGINKEFVSVIPFPVPDGLKSISIQAKTTNTIIPAEKYLFYPAQFWPHKNHILCLEVLKKLNQIGYNFHLVFTGSDKGNLEFIKEKITDYNLNEFVHFHGFVPIEDLYSIYQNAFCLIFPTFLGPDNIPPLEAFYLNCPVVASNIRGAEQQIGDAAILADPKNPDAFVAAIEKLLNEPEYRKTVILKAKIKADLLSSDRYVESALHAIRTLKPYRDCWSNKKEWIHL